MTQITVPNVATEVEYSVTSSSTGPFTVPFPFFDDDDVQCLVTNALGVETTLVVTTGFTWTTQDVPVGQEGNGYEGGTITLVSAIGADGATTLKIFRDTVIDRTSNYPSTGPFSVPLLNDEQNKHIMLMQELAEEIVDGDAAVDAANLSIDGSDTMTGALDLGDQDLNNGKDAFVKSLTIDGVLTTVTAFAGNNIAKTYLTVAAMVVASDLTTADTAITQGQVSAGDGGAGVWIWDSSVPATTYDADTNKVFFAYAAGSTTDGCWRRVLGGIIFEVTIPIGAAERYTTVNAALNHLKYLAGQMTADVILELETGFTMAEQVIISNGIDLSSIRITSVDAQVTVNRSTLTQASTGLEGFQGIGSFTGLFMAGGNSTLPRIDTIFAFDSTGAAAFAKCGIFITNGSKCIVEPGAGIHDTDGSGAEVYYSSTLIAPLTVWDNNGTDKASTSVDLCGIRAAFQGIVSAQEATVTNSNDHGIQIIGASIASLRSAVVTSAADVGIYGGGSSVIHARGINVTLCGGVGLAAYEGCTVRLIQSTISNNTGSGVFLDSAATVNCSTGCVIDSNGSYGVNVTGNSRFSISTPQIDGNTLAGVRVADGSSAFISSGSVKNNGTNDDFSVASMDSRIFLSGAITTTSGNTSDNNVTDSNVAAFNCPTVSGDGGIYGRGGDSGNRGTASIPSGSTSVTVTHNVDFTPLIQEVSVTPTNDWNLATRFWISNMTDTQFTINCSPDPGAGGMSFGWNVQRKHG